MRDGHEVIGIANGWAGLVGEFEGDPPSAQGPAGVIGQGGTCSAPRDTTSTNRRVDASACSPRSKSTSTRSSPSAATEPSRSPTGSPNAAPAVVGVPKTLDNDLPGTDYCIGFDTAISIVAESLDRLHTTAASHHRVIVVETMVAPPVGSPRSAGSRAAPT